MAVRAQAAGPAARPLSPPRPRPRRAPRRARGVGGAQVTRPPRRLSGPSRHADSAAVPASAGALSHPFGALLRIADHGLLERLIRGRLWIGLIAFALIGIVAMQLVVLRLNTEIGSGLERKATLQREISGLQVSNSTLSAFGRVETEAGRRGMRSATQPEGGFLSAHSSDALKAAALLSSSPPLGSTGQASASRAPSAGESATSGAAEGPSSSAPSTQLPASGAAETTAAGQGGAQAENQGPAGENAAGEHGASAEQAQQQAPQAQQEAPQAPQAPQEAPQAQHGTPQAQQEGPQG